MARDKNEAINSYITDMIALEDHIEKAIGGQLSNLKGYPEVAQELRQLHRTIEHHLSDLRQLAEARHASGAVEAIKRAGSAMAGMGAAIIDRLRTEGLPKDLRDDYTALSLASISYVMLHATALSLGEQEVADLAHHHFMDYAQALTRLHRLVPPAVVQFLQEEGLPATDAVLPDVGRMVRTVWNQAQEQGQPGSMAPGARPA